MTTIAENLNKIWSEFRKIGITDDLVVIEYIARLLLEKVLDISVDTMGSPFRTSMTNKIMGFLTDYPPHKTFLSDPSLMGIPYIDMRTNIVPMSTLPRYPENIRNLNLELIQKNLDNAIDQAESIPNLFNHYILFRLSNRSPGGRYPTPRQIAQFIYKLAQVEPHHRLADFACGSGGFLVERELTVDNYNKTWGIDISPEWIRLAYANVALRKIPPQLVSGNALDVVTSNDWKEKTFDRILMNPPFGEKIDSNLATEKLGLNVGSRSETALITLAIQKLADDGIAVILVPSGLLFSNSKAETTLRRTLIDEYHLKEVITLPKDALQPYSPLQSHILLIHRPPSPNLEKKMTWFFQLEEDGYPSGKSRDLTQQPDLSKSDFPFVESVLNRLGDEFDDSLPESNLQLGVLIPQNQILDKNYDLRPEIYIDKQIETRSSNSSVELLTRIYTNQKQLTQNLETLFSRIELPPISIQKLPSPLEKTFNPIGQLNPQQQEIWKKIHAKTQHDTNDNGENDEIALHFTPQEIETDDNGEISDTTQRTFELLEAMGVIIPVTIDNKLYYRRVTQRDLWIDSDSSASNFL